MTGATPIEVVENLAQAFREVFGCAGRLFGNPPFGVSDASEGVQWHAWTNHGDIAGGMGVNLEGMKYDGWPVARLIERELRHPTLFQVFSTVPTTDPVEVHWARDAWQGAYRVEIREHDIAPTPLLLSNLRPDLWRRTLADALDCLDADNGHRGRGRQIVTLSRSGQRVPRAVSPHLSFGLRTGRAWSTVPEWTEYLRHGRERLKPLYEWAADRAR